LPTVPNGRTSWCGAEHRAGLKARPYDGATAYSTLLNQIDNTLIRINIMLMVRSLGWILVSMFALVLPAAAGAQDRVRIEDVGLDGYFGVALPTPVRVHIPALDQTESVTVRFLVESGTDPRHRSLKRTDRFSETVQMTRGEPLELEAPITMPNDSWETLTVSVTSEGDKLVGEAEQEIQARDKLVRGETLVAVFCGKAEKCASAESQITYGSAEGTNNGKDLRQAVLTHFLSKWWGYSGARAVVVATSTAGITPAQNTALEDYLRWGGAVVLVEKEIGDKSLLAGYRQGAPRLVRVGPGALYTVPSLESQQLGQVIAELLSPRPASTAVSRSYSIALDTKNLLEQVGVAFKFPRLRWLILWLSVYLVVVGPLNFAVLHRMRRLEWGWISICVISLAFACALYIASSKGRPANFALDRASFYWMYASSPIAEERSAVRVSSPERKTLSATVN